MVKMKRSKMERSKFIISKLIGSKMKRSKMRIKVEAKVEANNLIKVENKIKG